MTGWGAVAREQGADTVAARWLALVLRGFSGERSAAQHALNTWPNPALGALARQLDAERAAKRPADDEFGAEADFIVGFKGQVPAEVVEGSSYLGGIVIRVNAALRHVVLRSPNAVQLAALGGDDDRIRFIELDRW